MRFQSEDQAQQIGDEEDDSDFHAELSFGSKRVAPCDQVENSRNYQRYPAERQHCGSETGRRAIEPLRLEADASQEYGQAKDKEDISDDRSGNRSLYQILQAGPQGQKGDDQLRRIPERGVEQSAETLAQFFGQVLSGFAHEARQRNDRQAGGDKDINRAGMDQVLQHDRRRNEYQQQIEKILGREQSLHFLVVLVPSGKDGGPTRILFCGTWYGTRIFTGLTD